jgi:hypothetical protein
MIIEDKSVLSLPREAWFSTETFLIALKALEMSDFSLNFSHLKRTSPLDGIEDLYVIQPMRSF